VGVAVGRIAISRPKFLAARNVWLKKNAKFGAEISRFEKSKSKLKIKAYMISFVRDSQLDLVRKLQLSSSAF